MATYVRAAIAQVEGTTAAGYLYNMASYVRAAIARFYASERALEGVIATVMMALVGTGLAGIAVVGVLELRWARSIPFVCALVDIMLILLWVAHMLSDRLMELRRSTASATSTADESVAITITDELLLQQKLPFAEARKTWTRAMEDSTEECGVCLEAFEGQDEVNVLPPCNHVFHVDCVKAWLPFKPSCPLCRRQPDFGSPQIEVDTPTANSATLDID
ncbi:hypothetical protein L7F22_037897 [Adiantum nelumboides]|nr:hypothetical protein [Adiantum nelumboides]